MKYEKDAFPDIFFVFYKKGKPLLFICDIIGEDAGRYRHVRRWFLRMYFSYLYAGYNNLEYNDSLYPLMII